MKYLRYTCSFVCVLLFSKCNTVYKGQVISESTGKPLKGVSVTLQNYEKASSIIVSEITDIDGNFKLTIPSVLRPYVKKEANVYLTCDNFQALYHQLIQSDKRKNKYFF